MASHPPHLTSTFTSAFIPFCAYQADLTMSENPFILTGLSYPLCSSFLPSMLEGQLCFKLKLNKTSDKGKANELMLLLDYNEQYSIQTAKQQLLNPSALLQGLGVVIKGMNMETSARSIQDTAAKVYIHTLVPYVGFGGGRYKITNAKRMTAKSDFLDMSFEDRGCEMKLYEDCRTEKLIKKCACVPYEVPQKQVQ